MTAARLNAGLAISLLAATLGLAQPPRPPKPIRVWMEVGDRDLFNPGVMRDDMHDWVVANENMAIAPCVPDLIEAAIDLM